MQIISLLLKVAILPLIKKNHSEKAHEIFALVSKHFRTFYDETGSIGKRYRRQDSIGTPFAVTIDEETLQNGTVTVRERDSMKQQTVKLENLIDFLKTNLE